MSYKILSNILLSRLRPYVGEIIGDQCEIRRNISTIDNFLYHGVHFRVIVVVISYEIQISI
jgi:hypothetical protein